MRPAGCPVPPCNGPIRTRKDDHSEIMLHCRICHNEYTTYEEFYAHNPCKIDETDDEDGDDTDSEQDDYYSAPWLPGGYQAHLARVNAEDCLKYFNSMDGNKKYEFVEGGPMGGATISRGPIYHINFKAKEKDNPDAQVETFFAQLRTPNDDTEVDCCVSLGPSHKLPYWRKADVRDCAYCKWGVHHPAEKCEKQIMGIKHEDVTWLYGEISESEKNFLFGYSDVSSDDLGLYD